ncbi:2-oxoglutarate dehydrogenase E1 component [Candidatus Johnevansia muelleri]|uniref:oxoglutarate dehydrogenase (succinyl-transferring) n=1 Tax=Candidatus Johnevansia muelleri TaxID=1495769 RepID=A0A078KHJ3_9GAMM|nr:2-oxoglutarate dehydrogenase E1 component [Candidatus Evansia muelleri]
MQNSMLSTSHINVVNAQYIENIYEQYLNNVLVSEDWKNYFNSLINYNFNKNLNVNFNKINKKTYILKIIDIYRYHGNNKSNIDPLGLSPLGYMPEINLSFYDLNNEDIQMVFKICELFIINDNIKTSIDELHLALNKTYCSSIGYEFMHIVNIEEKIWLQERFEDIHYNKKFNKKQQRNIIKRLIAAECLENYLDKKYPGTKRFGIEGGDSFIPMFDEIINRSGKHGIKEIVICMAHRGRINILINVLGKNPSELINEFEGNNSISAGSGDVKYHQGFSSNVMTLYGKLHLTLAFNPSHLEIISPVVAGSARALQDMRNDNNGDEVIAICVHGDAAFSGQGVVLETLQMSQTSAFKIGGTVHIIINNQIGFTTDPQDARSSYYCTDVAKTIQSPIFHVNGDDPESVIYVVQKALDYRQKFKKDVFIDFVCYRRHGHNEADEPSITQPIMYNIIKNHKNTREIYANYLIIKGIVSSDEIKTFFLKYRNCLDNGSNVANKILIKQDKKNNWYSYSDRKIITNYDTSFDIVRLRELSIKMCEVSKKIEMQRQVNNIYESRKNMIAGDVALNWGFAEMLAYATLLDEGYSVRITGQDSRRGTFSHRHAVIHNQKDGVVWIPMQHIKYDQPPFYIYDSLLSEEAVLAFEYGYATTNPKMLVVWEAQFGDFANGAQVVIDQFISSGESKWGRLCCLTIILPHGYEGQGPEHSSARIERFLQLSAEQNIQVCVPTTPAQMFHLLRRQIIYKIMKPLIIMQTKSLLRNHNATSNFKDLAFGSFQKVILDNSYIHEKINRVILVYGKLYYDLSAYRDKNNFDDTAILRIEQLYPFPEENIIEKLYLFTNAEKLVWCQDEPQNQGAWYQIQHYLHKIIEKRKKLGFSAMKIHLSCRPASAATASGYMSVHIEQQNLLVYNAFK